METPKLKVCSTCRIAQPLTEFWRNRKRPDGYQNQCRACMRVSTNASEKLKPEDGPMSVSQATINKLLDALKSGPSSRHLLKRLTQIPEERFGVALATCLSLRFVGFRTEGDGVVFYRR